jgi:hypothetical protein
MSFLLKITSFREKLWTFKLSAIIKHMFLVQHKNSKDVCGLWYYVTGLPTRRYIEQTPILDFIGPRSIPCGCSLNFPVVPQFDANRWSRLERRIAGHRQETNTGIGIPASRILVWYRNEKMLDYVSLVRYRTCSGIVSFFSVRYWTRVATKVGFHNFAKYEISRNTLLISRNFAKLKGTNFAKFRQGI